MTAHYWEMKLSDGFVYHEGEYKRIELLDVHKQVPGDAVYPEDYLPAIRFRVKEEWLKFEDFETRFPKERYVRNKGKAVWGGRTMQKSYKLLPCYENFRTNSDDMSLEQWLNAPKPRFDQPESLFDWDKEDCIFADDLAGVKTGKFSRQLMVSNTSILTLRRTLTTMNAIPEVHNIPDELIQRFPKLDECLTDGIPYDGAAAGLTEGDFGKPDMMFVNMNNGVLEDPGLNYEWWHVDPDLELQEDYQFTIITLMRDKYLQFMMEGEVWSVTNPAQLIDCDLTHGQYEDLHKIMINNGVGNG